MIFTDSILALPFAAILLCLQFFLGACISRLTGGQLPPVRSTRFYQALKELVDPAPQYVERRLTAWLGRPSPRWASWAVVIGGSLFAQYLIASLIVAVR